MKMPEMRMATMMQMRITPEIAKDYLKNNYSGQRVIKTPIVHKFARDMKEGRWNEEICDPIQFTGNGTLINGQHRLKAVIESGSSIWMWIQTGLKEEDFKNIDLGAKRNASDFMRGKKNSKNLSAVARYAYATKHGDASLAGIIHGYMSITPREYVSDTCILLESENPLVDEASAEGLLIRRAIKCGAGSIFGYGIWLLKWLADPFAEAETKIDDYVNDLISLSPTQSTAVIVAWFKNSLISGKKVSIDDQLALFLYGYECFVANRKLKVYQPKNGVLKKYDALIKETRERPEVHE